MSTKRKAKRGGARNTGMVLGNNSSGLSGIWFQKRIGTGADPVWHVYVCSAWTDKEGKARRTAYSVRHRGAEAALISAMAMRVSAGLPVPSMQEALAKLMEFLKEGPDPGSNKKEDE